MNFVKFLNTSFLQNTSRLFLSLPFCWMEIQEIYEMLQDTGGKYEEALAKLDEHFDIKKNVPLFREAKQESQESLDQFITKSRKLTTYCEYVVFVNNEIRDQVIHKCKSSKLRTRLLQQLT